MIRLLTGAKMKLAIAGVIVGLSVFPAQAQSYEEYVRRTKIYSCVVAADWQKVVDSHLRARDTEGAKKYVHIAVDWEERCQKDLGK